MSHMKIQMMLTNFIFACEQHLTSFFLNSGSQGIASEHPERFFVAEIVREKIFLQYRDEVPYACQVKQQLVNS